MMRRRPGLPRALQVALRTLLCSLLLLLPVEGATAHELEETAVTLVVREGGALELRLVCTWSRLLLADRVATPAAAREQLARLAAESDTRFATRVNALRRTIESSVRARAVGNTHQAFTAWQWPAARAVQEAIRQELMAAMTGGAGDHHASRMTTTARLVVGPTTPAVQLELPKQLGPVLLTVVRPQEQWLAPGQPSPPVALRAR